MRLSIAHIFSEHMVLQRHKPIYVFGSSIEGDLVTVTLNEQSKQAKTINGHWLVELDKEEANNKTSLKVVSSLLSEEIVFNDVAIGEVWLAGGQSNMEFIMKYDEDYLKMLESQDDDLLRYFAYPQVSYCGQLEKDGMGKFGLWRKWNSPENRQEFSAIALYMARILREKLNVPVGIISCNWGGTPASAWTKLEDVENNPKLNKIIAWKNECLAKLDIVKYLEASEKPTPKPTKQQEEFTDYFMMGGDMSKFFSQPLPPMDVNVFSPYNPGPRACIFPGNLYENMLKKIAPYTIKGFIFYQGEDDDAREWYDFYDESMKTMINSWRNLWAEELPFFQIELAPFRGYSMNGAKKYDLIRHKQNEVSKALNQVYDVCILDAGDEYNIHPRHKAIVGNRLGNMVMKHVYQDDSRIADCPEIENILKKDDTITLLFKNLKELIIKNDLKACLKINNNNDYDYKVNGNELIITIDTKQKLLIEYCEDNYCVPSLFNEEGNPVFGFRKEII